MFPDNLGLLEHALQELAARFQRVDTPERLARLIVRLDAYPAYLAAVGRADAVIFTDTGTKYRSFANRK